MGTRDGAQLAEIVALLDDKFVTRT